ncbi:hypothetical protein WMO63_06010 [Niallia sp. CLA-SR-H024]|uniref:Uncharacterized protein n=2 Tax=Niallia hominis TaxID=3133173 RepID=A0ABV1EVV1_9BACI
MYTELLELQITLDTTKVMELLIDQYMRANSIQHLVYFIKTIFTYFLKSDLNEGIYDNKQIGFIAEAAPMLRKGDTINMYKGLSMNRKATQELITRLEEAEHKIADLEMAVN